MEIPLIGPTYETRAVNQNNQRLINWFLVPDQVGGKHQNPDTAEFVLYPTPGTKSFSSITGTEVRGLHQHRGVLYAVVDATLYTVDSAGTETSRGTLETSSGTVQIEATDTELMLIDDSYGYIYNITTPALTRISDADFPGDPETLTEQDGYFIISVKDSGKFYLSDLNDGKSWSALSFATAEGHGDHLIAAFSDRRDLWLFGTDTIEVWENTGAATVPFERKDGVYMESGLAAKGSISQTENTMLWLSNGPRGRGQVMAAQDFNALAVSTLAIDYQISQYTTIEDAEAYVYQDEGHEFYVLNFPTEDRTWVYDITSRQWHERQSEVGGAIGRHVGHHYAFFGGKHIVGDRGSGDLLEMDMDTYTDNSKDIRRVRRTVVQHNDGKRISIYNLEVEVEHGVGLQTGQGSDPQLMLRTSKDGGHTWSNEMQRSPGKVGIYNNRLLWNRLGQGREWVLELAATDPVKWILIGARVDAEVGED